MTEQTQVLHKEMIGTVTSDKMQRTVVVQVTTFKLHPLYHKRYRWTKKYLSDIGSVEPKIGDTVRIQSSRPLSKLKRWVVVEVMNVVNQASQQPKRKVVVAVKAKTATKKKAK